MRSVRKGTDKQIKQSLNKMFQLMIRARPCPKCHWSLSSVLIIHRLQEKNVKKKAQLYKSKYLGLKRRLTKYTSIVSHNIQYSQHEMRIGNHIHKNFRAVSVEICEILTNGDGGVQSQNLLRNNLISKSACCIMQYSYFPWFYFYVAAEVVLNILFKVKLSNQ